jgi:hypothetical protein
MILVGSPTFFARVVVIYDFSAHYSIAVALLIRFEFLYGHRTRHQNQLHISYLDLHAHLSSWSLYPCLHRDVSRAGKLMGACSFVGLHVKVTICHSQDLRPRAILPPKETFSCDFGFGPDLRSDLHNLHGDCKPRSR